ncbi:MAG: hypothetical protein ACTS3R_01790 [Inquilinaceae bacterium]
MLEPAQPAGPTTDLEPEGGGAPVVSPYLKRPLRSLDAVIEARGLRTVPGRPTESDPSA